jgi:hypothetical protein
MTDHRNPFAPSLTNGPGEQPEGSVPEPSTGEAPAASGELPSTAILKFKSCRWRCDPEAGEFCTHRDVLPFAGKEGFVPDSWCPDCAFYKLRRTPKKRDYSDRY